MTEPYGGRFTGRSALVTGGGSGIGAALTRALVAAGARVHCADIDAAAAARVAAAATGPGSAVGVELDVTDAVAVAAAVAAATAPTGRLDLLFNNAGIVIGGPTEELTLEQWNRIIDINLRGVVHGVQAAYPRMIAAGTGHIVNTASAAGLMASGLLTSYCATKFAVVGLSEALRTEAVHHGVGVTVVCPSAVETPILDSTDSSGFAGRAFFLGAENTERAYSPERLAADVLAAVARDRARVVVPGRTRVGWLVGRAAPGFLARRTARYVGTRLPRAVTGPTAS
ncbi:SDR family NAD(P)-dependent oxidoreductase [Nocardia jiangsuensis]|uniref:SDR family NAD(P)-dependent oxidoreductase n=1 Tax=Nocardia jiangsuensis TaxID=1691563 RepID=A0ABV8DVY4_9NOCA